MVEFVADNIIAFCFAAIVVAQGFELWLARARRRQTKAMWETIMSQSEIIDRQQVTVEKLHKTLMKQNKLMATQQELLNEFTEEKQGTQPD